MNARSLFVCALAHAHLGNQKESRRLEQMGERLAMTGYGTVLDTPRLQLALHRNDLAAVQSLLGKPAVRTSNWFYLSAMAAHLDALAALGARERVVEEATPALQPGTYLEPFALRAQGIVDGVNEHRSRYEQIKRFEVLPREFSAEEDEITPTLKLRRRVVQEHFADAIERLYAL